MFPDKGFLSTGLLRRPVNLFILVRHVLRWTRFKREWPIAAVRPLLY